MTWDQLLPMLWEGTVETLYMTLWSSAIAYLIGLPLGVLLVVTRRGGIMPSVTFNAILGVAINFLRSIPFVIMIAVLFPVTRLVMGSSIAQDRSSSRWSSAPSPTSPAWWRAPLPR